MNNKSVVVVKLDDFLASKKSGEKTLKPLEFGKHRALGCMESHTLHDLRMPLAYGKTYEMRGLGVKD